MTFIQSRVFARSLATALFALVAFFFISTQAFAANISNGELSVDPTEGLIFSFQVDEALDLDASADVKIEYFTKEGSVETPIQNTVTNGDLVKDKTWDGYLWTPTGSYSQGDANTTTYSDQIPANTLLSTRVKDGYVSITDWTTPATYVVKLTVTSTDGLSEDNKEYEVTVADPSVRVVTNETELTDALADDVVETIIVEGTIGDSANFTAYEITEPVIITAGTDAKIYGSFIIKVDGVTVNGLTMYTRGGGNGPLKTAIDVIAKEVTITDNTFELPNPLAANAVGNGVTVWPVGAAEADYNISGNTFNGYDADTADWSSSALQLVEGLDLARFDMSGTVSQVVDLDPEVEKALALGNSYTDSSNNYVHSNWSAGPVYKYVLASTEDQLGSIAYAGNGATILVGEDISLTEAFEINKTITLDGNEKTITATNSVVNNAVLITASDVTIKDLAIDGADNTIHGLQAYKASNVVLDNLTVKNNGKSGLLVNGSTVAVTNIKTSGNGWNGINVDQGANVSEVATLTVNGTSAHTETRAIWIDDNSETLVTVTGAVSQYDSKIVAYIDGNNVSKEGTEYTLKAPVQPSTGGGGGGRSSMRDRDQDEDEEVEVVEEEDETEGEVLGAATSTPTTVAYYTFTVDFGIGSTGTDVTNLQTILMAAGLLDIDAPTGYFGQLTFAAVQKYQSAHMIPNTGFVGPLTRAQLNTTPIIGAAQTELIMKQIADLLAEVAKLQAELNEMLAQ